MKKHNHYLQSPLSTLNISNNVSGSIPSIRCSNWSKIFFTMIFCFFINAVGFAQADLTAGNTALQTASDGLGEYYDTFKTIIFILAGIIALLGAIRTFMKWNMGDPDVMSAAAAWFGSAIFLLIAVSVLESIFITG